MNTAIILAAGVGQRMRSGGLPKQFLRLMGKPIIIYTLEKFEKCEEISKIVLVCHGSYVDYMKNLLHEYRINKVLNIVIGGSSRQSSLQRGLDVIIEKGYEENDIIVVHDGVRPLVDLSTIRENIRIAKKYGCAITVHPVTESVIITETDKASMVDFKKRSDTYSMTSPQTFQVGKIIDAYNKIDVSEVQEIPLLDAAMVYAQAGENVFLVKEQGKNIKITTPEDFYILKAILEMEENKFVFGL